MSVKFSFWVSVVGKYSAKIMWFFCLHLIIWFVSLGICKDLIGRYECLCKNGFTGLRCEIPPNSTTIQTTPGGDTYCQSDTCLNNGTCFEDALFTYCLCPTWFTGTRCEKSLQKMLPTTVSA